MEKQTFEITIGRNQNGYYYSDRDTNVTEATMIEASGMLIARLAASIQHDEDKDNKAEYRIFITKTMNE